MIYHIRIPSFHIRQCNNPVKEIILYSCYTYTTLIFLTPNENHTERTGSFASYGNGHQ